MNKGAASMSAIGQRTSDTEWHYLYRSAAICCLLVVALIPIQSVIFLAFPPPTTVSDYFALFQQKPLLGLLDLDLLLSLDNILVIVVYVALYTALRGQSRTLASLALAFGLVGTTLYLVSREATFSMLSLSNQYTAATSAEQRVSLLAAGQTMLTIYNGGTFDTSYVLGGVAVLLFSFGALRVASLGKTFAVLGIITGALMLLPPTVGPVGLYVSMISLLPTMVWLILLATRLLRHHESASAAGRGAIPGA
jgi:hypothetical protein